MLWKAKCQAFLDRNNETSTTQSLNFLIYLAYDEGSGILVDVLRALAARGANKQVAKFGQTCERRSLDCCLYDFVEFTARLDFVVAEKSHYLNEQLGVLLEEWTTLAVR